MVAGLAAVLAFHNRLGRRVNRLSELNIRQKTTELTLGGQEKNEGTPLARKNPGLVVGGGGRGKEFPTQRGWDRSAPQPSKITCSPCRELTARQANKDVT